MVGTSARTRTEIAQESTAYKRYKLFALPLSYTSVAFPVGFEPTIYTLEECCLSPLGHGNNNIVIGREVAQSGIEPPIPAPASTPVQGSSLCRLTKGCSSAAYPRVNQPQEWRTRRDSNPHFQFQLRCHRFVIYVVY